MTPYQRIKRTRIEYKAKKLFKQRKNDKNYQLMIERCLKEARNPFYLIFNKIRYKLGFLKVEGEKNDNKEIYTTA